MTKTGAAVVRGSVAVILTLVGTGEATPQIDPARANLQHAIELANGGQKEESARLLVLAARQLEAVDHQVRAHNVKLHNEIHALLRRIDPHASEVFQLERRSAQKLIELAHRYTAKGWHATASTLLGKAHCLDPALARADLAIAKARLAPPGPDAALADLFGDARYPYGGDPWTLQDGVLRTPPMTGSGGAADSRALVGKRALPGDRRMSVEIRMGPRPGRFGFAFAVDENTDELYLVELLRRVDDTSIRLERVFHGRFEILAMRGWKFPPEIEQGWLPVEVTIRGRDVTVAAADLSPFGATLPTDPPPYVGFFVSGNTDNPEPIEIRHFAVETEDLDPDRDQ